MLQAKKHASCCTAYERLPKNVCCFAEDVSARLNQLLCKHQHAFSRRQRIHELARPKHRFVVQQFVPRCPCKFSNRIEMVHLEHPQYTRTEQLAYPCARKLMVYKKEILKNENEEYIHNTINRLLRNSLLSMYSRLWKVQPPAKPIPIHKWNWKEWRIHKKYLGNLAKHKVPPDVKPPPRESKPLKSLKRFKKLAKPKDRVEATKVVWALTPEIKGYAITPRMKELAKANIHDNSAMTNELPMKVRPEALTYKASPRIRELSTAPDKRAGTVDLKDNPFGISANALKAKASARVLELAEPKEAEDKHTRQNPSLISPAALKAKATPRTIELAKARGT